MNTEHFFEESSDQSEVKRSIVIKYFEAWTKVIIPRVKRRHNKIAYIDLFAGPGRYENGTKSTPILILEQAINNPNMRDMLVTIFNDRNSDHSRNLENAVNSIEGIERLRYKPQIYNDEVGTEIVKMFEQMKLVPTLFFVDPWGYKGLSLRLINAVLKDWGCDCIFFFNYTRINMGLKNPDVKEHLDALFGEKRAGQLREKLDGINVIDREMAIVEELTNALKEMGCNYVLPFGFKNARGTRTSHHLFFVSKSFRGYHIMKDVMAKESSKENQGVATFQYNPADRRFPVLFEFLRPLDDLENLLLNEFKGHNLKVYQIYGAHSVGKPYTLRNYKDVLIKMETDVTITANPSSDRRRRINGKMTMGEDVIIQFPN
jgi:three-Cys-motif partner protein